MSIQIGGQTQATCARCGGGKFDNNHTVIKSHWSYCAFIPKCESWNQCAVEELETLRHSLTISVRSKLLLQEAELKVMRLALSMACEDGWASGSSAMAAYEARARAALTKGAL